MTRKTRPASVNLAGIRDPAIRSALRGIVERLNMREGNLPNANKLDRFVSLRDLVDTGIAKVVGAISAAGPGFAYANPGLVDYTIPPAITGFTGSGALASVILSWDQPLFSNFSHVEIWRSDADDLGQAVKIGTTTAAFYTDEIGSGGSYYYWARIISRSSTKGPFNAVAGTLGETGYDPSYVMDVLTSQQWQPATAYSLFQVVAPSTDIIKNNIALTFQCSTAGTSGATEPDWNSAAGVGSQINDGTVVWTAVEAGTAPFVIGTINGQNVVAISGSLIVDGTLTGTKIQANEITGDHIKAAQTLVAPVISGGEVVSGAFYAGSDVFGEPGIQIEYNEGSPQLFIGSGNAFLKYTTADDALLVKTLNTALTGQRISINPSNDNQIHFYGDIRDGNGTIAELLTLGSLSNAVIDINAQGNTAAIFRSNYVYNQIGGYMADEIVLFDTNGDDIAPFAVVPSNSSSPPPTATKAWNSFYRVGSFFVDANANVYICTSVTPISGGESYTWKQFQFV